MASTRANLDNAPSNTLYFVLGLLLIIMSVLGWFLFRQLSSQAPPQAAPAPTPVPTADPVVEEVSPVPSLPQISPSELPASTPTLVPLSPSPTPAVLTLQMDYEGFSFDYPSYRKLYETVQAYGRRFTLYSSEGNITVHAGDSWSWSHPGRQFSDSQLISGHPTFVYEASNQTIVDVQVGDWKYTIQCVHNNNESIKSECRNLMSSFHLGK